MGTFVIVDFNFSALEKLHGTKKEGERERELKRGIIATLFLRDVECSVEELSRGRSTYFYVSALFTIQI